MVTIATTAISTTPTTVTNSNHFRYCMFLRYSIVRFNTIISIGYLAINLVKCWIFSFIMIKYLDITISIIQNYL